MGLTFKQWCEIIGMIIFYTTIISGITYGLLLVMPVINMLFGLDFFKWLGVFLLAIAAWVGMNGWQN